LSPLLIGSGIPQALVPIVFEVRMAVAVIEAIEIRIIVGIAND